MALFTLPVASHYSIILSLGNWDLKALSQRQPPVSLSVLLNSYWHQLIAYFRYRLCSVVNKVARVLIAVLHEMRSEVGRLLLIAMLIAWHS